MKNLRYLILPAMLAAAVLLYLLGRLHTADAVIEDHAEFLKNASSYEILNASLTTADDLTYITITKDPKIISDLLKEVQDAAVRKKEKAEGIQPERIICFETTAGMFTFSFADNALLVYDDRYPLRHPERLHQAEEALLNDPEAEVKLKHDAMNYNFLLPPAARIVRTENGFYLYGDDAEDLPVLEVIRTADGRDAQTILLQKKEEFEQSAELKTVRDAGLPRDLENSGCVYGLHGIYEDAEGNRIHLLGTAYDADQVMIAMTAVTDRNHLDDMITAINMIISTVSVGPLY